MSNHTLDKLGPLIQIRMESTKSDHDTEQTNTRYLDALIKYGKQANRFKGITLHDRVYANHHLDNELLGKFGYKDAQV